jgi:hypothetical protein
MDAVAALPNLFAPSHVSCFTAGGIQDLPLFVFIFDSLCACEFRGGFFAFVAARVMP